MASQGSFSTGLGLGDLRDVCRLRSINFESGLGGDGLWHSTVKLKAIRAQPKPMPQASDLASPMHLPKHVIIVDDMPSILKATAYKLRKLIPDAVVEDIRIHTEAS